MLLPLMLRCLIPAHTALAAPPPKPPVRVLVPQSTTELTPGSPAKLDTTLTVVLVEDGPVVLPVVDAKVAVQTVTVDGRPAGLLASGDQLHLVGRWQKGTHTVRLSGVLTTDGDAGAGSVALRMPPGAHTRVSVVAGADTAVTVDGAVQRGDGFYRTSPQSGAPVQVRWRPQGPPPVRPRTLHVDQQTVVTVDEAEAVARARIDLRVENGQLDTVPLRIPGGVETVEVLSPPGATARVFGERVEVRLTDPITDIARLDLRYRASAASDSAAIVPVPRVDGARGTHQVALLRGDDAVVIPAPTGRAESLAFADLPDGMAARLPGAPVAAFSLSEGAGLTWRRLQTTPAPEPPILIDHALYEASFVESGTGAIRATWQVRNDRAPFLRIRLPEGWSAVSARVAGRSVPLARDGDTLLVPLEKSTETMAGRVQLPVELSAIGPGDAWEKRGWHDLPGPTVNAPVSHVEWQVTLPPTRQVKRTDGARPWQPAVARVEMGRAVRESGAGDDWLDEDGDFGGGGGFGGDGPMGADAGRPARPGKRGEKKKKEKSVASSSSASKVLEQTARKRTSTAYWNAAYDAYKDNDFDRAEQLLEQSQALDPDNYAAQQLQSNIAVLNADVSSLDENDEAVARRVKAMARAKSGKTEEARERLEKEAKEAEQSGDVQKAAAAYRQLVQTTSQLATLEEDEAVDQKQRLQLAQEKLDALEQQVRNEDDARFSYLAEELMEAEEEPLDVGGDTVVMGGVEGGVVGGVVGGALGGVAAGVTGVEVANSRDNAGTVLTKDFLERVPAGRSYQAAVVPDTTPAAQVTDQKNQPVQFDELAPGAFAGDDLFANAEAGEVRLERNYIIIGDSDAPEPPPPPPPPAKVPPPPKPTPAFGEGKVIAGHVSKPELTELDVSRTGAGHGKGAAVTEYDFEDMEVSGELVKPQGALILDRSVESEPDPEPVDVVDAPRVVYPEPAAAAPPPPPVVQRMDYGDVERASESMVVVRRQPVRGLIRRTARGTRHAAEAVGDALVDAFTPPPPPPRAPIPDATPGMTPLPTGISAARGDVALPIDPERLLHVEQQLLPADTPATFRVQLRPDRS